MKHLHTQARRAGARDGFTLVEVMISMLIVMITMAGALALFISYRNAWVIASLAQETSNESSFGMERIVYGVGTNAGLRAAKAASVSLTFPSGGWQVTYNTNFFLQYNPGAQNIVNQDGDILCEGVINSSATLTNSGCSFIITVSDSGGGRYATNSIGSFVQFRN